jgi:hypothetical protein
MNKLRSGAAFLLAIPLVVFGGGHFLGWIELPPGERLLQAMRDGGLMGVIAASHVLVGVMLILPRTRFLGALVQLPMTLGIVAFHATMLPAGLPVALVLLALNLVALDPARVRMLLVEAPRDA